MIQDDIVDAIAEALELPLTGKNSIANSLRQQRAALVTQCASRMFSRERGVCLSVGATRDYDTAKRAVLSFLLLEPKLAHLARFTNALSKPMVMSLVLSVLAIVEARRSEKVLSFLAHVEAYAQTCISEEKYTASWWRRAFTRQPDFSKAKAEALRGMADGYEPVIRYCYPQMHQTAYASLYASMESGTRFNFPTIERFVNMYGSGGK